MANGMPGQSTTRVPNSDPLLKQFKEIVPFTLYDTVRLDGASIQSDVRLFTQGIGDGVSPVLNAGVRDYGDTSMLKGGELPRNYSVILKSVYLQIVPIPVAGPIYVEAGGTEGVPLIATDVQAWADWQGLIFNNNPYVEFMLGQSTVHHRFPLQILPSGTGSNIWADRSAGMAQQRPFPLGSWLVLDDEVDFSAKISFGASGNATVSGADLVLRLCYEGWRVQPVHDGAETDPENAIQSFLALAPAASS